MLQQSLYCFSDKYFKWVFMASAFLKEFALHPLFKYPFGCATDWYATSFRDRRCVKKRDSSWVKSNLSSSTSFTGLDDLKLLSDCKNSSMSRFWISKSRKELFWEMISSQISSSITSSLFRTSFNSSLTVASCVLVDSEVSLVLPDLLWLFSSGEISLTILLRFGRSLLKKRIV